MTIHCHFGSKPKSTNNTNKVFSVRMYEVVCVEFTTHLLDKETLNMNNEYDYVSAHCAITYMFLHFFEVGCSPSQEGGSENVASTGFLFLKSLDFERAKKNCTYHTFKWGPKQFQRSITHPHTHTRLKRNTSKLFDTIYYSNKPP